MMGSLLTSAAGHDMKFRLRIEIAGKTPEDIIEKLNQLLNEVSDSFKFNDD
jgi:hypothetical protein